jgi:hypothetical protein
LGLGTWKKISKNGKGKAKSKQIQIPNPIKEICIKTPFLPEIFWQIYGGGTVVFRGV